ncbi:MAG: hypothetical protein AAFV25_12440 [Bacteroidota bacterium]
MQTHILVLHLLSSLYMFGLIWFVQIVHYPLMAAVGKGDFVAYERLHTQRTGTVVGPAMLAELFTGVVLWFWGAFEGQAHWIFGGSLLALALIWASTFFIQIPLHSRLSNAHSKDDIRRLVNSNWIRTILWSARAVVLAYLIV